MKEGFVLGLMVGAFAGMMVYRYNKDVQKIADKDKKNEKNKNEIAKKKAKKIKKEITPKQQKK